MSAAKIQGREKLLAKLRALPVSTRKHLRPAIEKGAQELVQMQKRMAPVDDGHLRDSVGYEMDETGLRAVVSAGGKKAFYATFVEHGTKNKSAQPFFYPAWRALRKRIKARIRRATTMAAKEVAKNGK